MVRKRLAFLTSVAGFVLVAGCTSTNNCPGEQRPGFFERFRRHPQPECCIDSTTAAAPVVTEGPVLSEGNATIVSPTPSCGTPGAPCNQPAPTTMSPPLQQPPRLVPQPLAQPRPYGPPQ